MTLLATLLYLLAMLHPESERFPLAASGVVLWVSQDGRVLASGDDESTRGDDGEQARCFFQAIPELQGIVSVDLVLDGSSNAAALDRNGRVWLWGSDWGDKLHGRGSDKDHVPALVPGLEGMRAVALGDHHLVALGWDGKVRTLSAGPFGNEYGQLGTGDREGRDEVWVLPGIGDAIAIAAEGDVTLVLRKDGTVWGVGNGVLLGQERSFLDFDYTQREELGVLQPTQVPGLSNIREISVGKFFCVALDRSGQVWGWGVNDSGQLGLPADDMNVSAPRKLKGLTRIQNVSAGYDFLLALTEDGRVLAQGGNVYGALGDKKNELEGAQREVPGIREATRVFAGHYNAFAQLRDGSMVGWGANSGDVGGFHPQAQKSSIPPIALDPDLRPLPPSSLVQDGGVLVRLFSEIDEDEWKQAQFEVLVRDSTVGRLELDREVLSGELTFEVPAGTHRYVLRGELQDEQGRKHRLSRAGVLIVQQGAFQDNLEASIIKLGPEETFKRLRARIGEVSQTLAKRLPPLEAEGPLSESELLPYEKDRPLPKSYRELLATMGPFRFGPTSTLFPRLALYSPGQAPTLAEYVAKGLSYKDKEPEDELDSEIVWSFASMAEELNTSELKSARKTWAQNRIGAVMGEELYQILGEAKSPSGTPYPQCLTDLFYEDTNEEGELLRFAWLEWSEDDLAIKEQLVQALAHEWVSECSELGIASLHRREPPAETQAFLEIEFTEDERPVLKLTTAD